MRTFSAFVTFLAAFLVCDVCYGYQCCSSYNDFTGKYHASELCENYCCWTIGIDQLKTCCDNPMRQVPATDRDQDSCVKSWISEHIWVPILCGAVVLGLIVLCTCCCCCGCCCCRKEKTVVVHSPGMVPQTSVVMSQQSNTNVMHAGYDQ